jgi:transposase
LAFFPHCLLPKGIPPDYIAGCPVFFDNRSNIVSRSGVIADLPVFPIEKGIAGPGLLAQIMIDKFVDHLPIYRQIERFKREGIKIASSTINGWQEAVFNLLEPLYDTLKHRVLSQGYLQVDEPRRAQRS